MPVITTIQDLKDIYARRVPQMFYDYCESGSWTEQTFRDNISDFSQLRLRQRVAVDMANRTTATKMIGQDVSMPVALAPVGLTGMQCADGEIKAAKAAAAATSHAMGGAAGGQQGLPLGHGRAGHSQAACHEARQRPGRLAHEARGQGGRARSAEGQSRRSGG